MLGTLSRFNRLDRGNGRRGNGVLLAGEGEPALERAARGGVDAERLHAGEGGVGDPVEAEALRVRRRREHHGGHLGGDEDREDRHAADHVLHAHLAVGVHAVGAQLRHEQRGEARQHRQGKHGIWHCEVREPQRTARLCE